ncbi:ABC transporter permease subunit [Candidatus Eisenbacteria bacterium]|uniref:ABC transporter permease subunit n=1 Tax=Eiseniibacteriota bacterium TaxID=2212470 RepID=A0ABV6YHY7_UNCEI
MNRRRSLAGAWLVLRKEVCESLRDRNLIVQLIIIPAFLYPVLGFGAFQVIQISEGALEAKRSVVWVDMDAPASIVESLRTDERLTLQDTPPELDHLDRSGAPEQFRALRDGLRDSEEDAPVALLSWHSDQTTRPVATVAFDSSRDRSKDARETLLEIIEAHRDSLVLAGAQAVGLEPADIQILALEEKNTASSHEMGSWILSLVLPLFLILMLAQGSFYGSLDTVVGERERGTLETTLSSPLNRGHLMLGKFLYVVTSSMVAFLLNLVSLTLFTTLVLKLVDLGDSVQFTLPLVNVLLMVLAALLTASLLASVMMLVSLPAKTYREGQAALTPVFMITLAVAFVAITHQGGFTVLHALIPLINVVGLLRALLAGDPPLVPMLITFGVLLVVAASAMRLAARKAAHEGAFFDQELTLRKLLRHRGGGS